MRHRDHPGGDHGPDHNHIGGHRAGRRGEHGHGRRGRARLFDYGEMRLLLLSLIADKPSHGYELIKAVEELTGGSYTPSPGLIYPTLSWLDDMDYVYVETRDSGRKSYRLSAEGQEYLAGQASALEELRARLQAEPATGRHRMNSAVLRAMENLKTALRLRLREGPIDEEEAGRIADTIDAAAKAVEKGR